MCETLIYFILLFYNNMLINVMLLVSIKACTRILFSLFLCNYHQLFSAPSAIQ